MKKFICIFIKTVVMVPILLYQSNINLYMLKPTDEFNYKILKKERFSCNSLDVINNPDFKSKLNSNLSINSSDTNIENKAQTIYFLIPFSRRAILRF